MILAGFAINVTTEGDFTQYTWWAAAVLSLIVIVSAVLKYLFFRYQLLDDAVQVKQGILFKKRLNLKFSRIQNVNIRHPFYFRPLGLVTLKIDGAGSKGEEVSLSALTQATANSIRQTIRIKKEGIDAVQNHQTAELKNQTGVDAENEEAFYRRTLTDLVIHGLTNNRAWFVLAGLFAALQYTSISFGDLVRFMQVVVSYYISNQNVAFTVVLFTVSVVLAVFLTAFLSVVGSILTYYGFTLFRSDKSMMVHRGLINKQEFNMQKSRVQSIYIRQDWLDLVLGRANVIYEQISHSPNDPNQADSGKRIVVPSARSHEITKLVAEIFPISDVAELSYTPISKRYFYKYSIIWSVIYLIIAVVIITQSENQRLSLIVAIIWPYHVFLIYMIWKRAGITLIDDIVIIRRGIIGVDYIIFPAYKIQAVDYVQSLLMKRHELSNLIFHTASRTARINYLPSQLVRKIIDFCVYRAESSSRSWM